MDPVQHVVDPAARVLYTGEGLDDEAVEVLSGLGPLPVLEKWYAEAAADQRVVEPGAMVVATVDDRGLPNARTVLLKGLDRRGLTFFTNLSSAKGRELASTPYASVVLLWHPMYRQVRLRGPVEPVDREDAAAYFASRPHGSQVSAWASRQSEPVASRRDLEAAFAEQAERWDGVEPLPLPDFWGGLRVRPVEVELWAGRPDRMHDRVQYRTPDGEPALLDDPAAWRVQRLQP